MKTKKLNPNQIITLNDYPLHSNEVLSEYLSKCKAGEKLPFVPVIKKSKVRKHLDNNLLKELKKFEKENPLAEYFMLDGSHRTTALTLSGQKIVVIIYEQDEDISEAKKLVVTGQILENETLDHNLEENCKILNRLFNKEPYFMTVRQKTEKVAKENLLSI